VIVHFQPGMATQTIRNMEKDTIANATTLGAVFAYLMQFQGEITILLLLTGLALNIFRIYDRLKKGKDGEENQ